MNPLVQWSTDALHTATLHICIYIYIYIYTYIYEGDEPPGQSIIDPLHTTTLYIYI